MAGFVQEILNCSRNVYESSSENVFNPLHLPKSRPYESFPPSHPDGTSRSHFIIYYPTFISIRWNFITRRLYSPPHASTLFYPSWNNVSILFQPFFAGDNFMSPPSSKLFLPPDPALKANFKNSPMKSSKLNSKNWLQRATRPTALLPESIFQTSPLLKFFLSRFETAGRFGDCYEEARFS